MGKWIGKEIVSIMAEREKNEKLCQIIRDERKAHTEERLRLVMDIKNLKARLKNAERKLEKV